MTSKPATTLTVLELQAVRAAFVSASSNGHDFGFIEDIVRKLRPLKAQAVGAIVTSLISKGFIRVHAPVKTDSGTFTQFTWVVSPDDVSELIK